MSGNGRDGRPGAPALQFAGQHDYGPPVTAPEKPLRARVFDILRPNDPMPGSRRWRQVHLVILGIGLLAVTLLSIDEVLSPHRVVKSFFFEKFFMCSYFSYFSFFQNVNSICMHDGR